ncbi:MAG TPA: STAS domain-containing protein [Tepidisphaeraceae bacterium]|jgi:anti-anti-sigma factor|nr:STAS domain-containing protein [Tepidisphaeraceae bacterium]
MSSQRFQISQEQAVNVLQFFLPPSLDTLEIDSVIESVLQNIGTVGHGPWVVDLSQVQYMGSSMLGLFVNIRERIRQGGGTLVLCAMSPPLLRIFRTCCLERLFTIVNSRPEALNRATRG